MTTKLTKIPSRNSLVSYGKREEHMVPLHAKNLVKVIVVLFSVRHAIKTCVALKEMEIL